MFKKFLFFLLLALLTPKLALAQINSQTLETQVVAVQEQYQQELLGTQVTYQKLQLKITKGDRQGQTFIVENGTLPIANPQIYHQGDRLLVIQSQDLQGDTVYNIVDYIRRDALLLITLIFVILTIGVVRLRGLTSILATAFSYLIIFAFILPQIIQGRNPVVVTLLGCLVIIPVTFILSYGFSQKTYIAMVSTLISLIITGLLSHLFVKIGHLTGFSSEEAAFLQDAAGMVNIQGLVLSGIIIGSLGILDDVTISQASIVSELKKSSPQKSKTQIFQSAMTVGRDHIASMVNTLVLAYTGAAMPLLLLFVSGNHPFSTAINYEIIAEEIIRTLTGSIGLILCVPFTTFLAANFISTPSK